MKTKTIKKLANITPNNINVGYSVANIHVKQPKIEHSYLPDFLQNVKTEESENNIYNEGNVYYDMKNNYIIRYNDSSYSSWNTWTVSTNTNSLDVNNESMYVNNQYVKNIFCSILSFMYCNEALSDLIVMKDYTLAEKDGKKIYFFPCKYQDFKLAFEFIFNTKNFSYTAILYVMKDYFEKIDITNFSIHDFLTVMNLVQFESDFYMKMLDVLNAINVKTKYIKNCRKYNEITGFSMKKILSNDGIDIYPSFNRNNSISNFYYDFNFLMIKDNKVFYPESFNDYLYNMQLAREKFYKNKKKKKIANGFYFLYYTNNDLSEVKTEFYSSDFVVIKNGYDKQHFAVINDLLCFLPMSLANGFFTQKIKESYEKQKHEMLKYIEKRMALDNILSSK